MTDSTTSTRTNAAYIFAFTFVCAVAFIYALIAVALVPYWQQLSGTEIQSWWSGPFTRFSYLMVPVHLMSIISVVYAFVLHWKRDTNRSMWLVALGGLLVCQGFNFFLHGAVYNPALQAGTLDPTAALEVFDQWDLYHSVRTVSVWLSLAALVAIGLRTKSS